LFHSSGIDQLFDREQNLDGPDNRPVLRCTRNSASVF